MGDLRELYQEVILEHARKPRNFRALPDATAHAEGYNPLCGDRVTVYLRLADGSVRDAGFQGQGCAISTASASLMTEAVRGHAAGDVESLFERFHGLVTGESPAGAGEDLGKLAVFAGVSEYPARVKCAILAWHAMRSALRGEGEVVSTE